MIKGNKFLYLKIVSQIVLQSLAKQSAEQRSHEALKNAIYFMILGISCGFITFLASYFFSILGQLLTKRLRVTVFANIINQVAFSGKN